MRINGVEQAVTIASVRDPIGFLWFGHMSSVTPNRSVIGARVTSNAPSGERFHGALISQIQAWDGVILTATQVRHVEATLAAKYGITLGA